MPLGYRLPPSSPRANLAMFPLADWMNNLVVPIEAAPTGKPAKWELGKSETKRIPGLADM